MTPRRSCPFWSLVLPFAGAMALLTGCAGQDDADDSAGQGASAGKSSGGAPGGSAGKAGSAGSSAKGGGAGQGGSSGGGGSAGSSAGQGGGSAGAGSEGGSGGSSAGGGQGGSGGPAAGQGGSSGQGGGGSGGSAGKGGSGGSGSESGSGGNSQAGSGGSSQAGSGGSAQAGSGGSAQAGSGGSGVSGSGGNASGVEWKMASLTEFESYPDPGSEECIKYNGCTWAGQFAALDGKQTEEWVKAHNIAAIHSKDFETYKLKTLRLRKNGKEIDVTVYDMCADSDCSGCCTENAKPSGFLIDLEKYTAERFGVPADGQVEWYCLDCE